MDNYRQIRLSSGMSVKLGIDYSCSEAAHHGRAMARSLNKLLRQDRHTYECGLAELRERIERAFDKGLHPAILAEMLNRDLSYGLTARCLETPYVQAFSIHRTVRKKHLTILEMTKLLPKGRQTVLNMGTAFLGLFNLEQLKDLIADIRCASQPDLSVILNELVRLNAEQVGFMKRESSHAPPLTKSQSPNTAPENQVVPNVGRNLVPTL